MLGQAALPRTLAGRATRTTAALVFAGEPHGVPCSVRKAGAGVRLSPAPAVPCYRTTPGALASVLAPGSRGSRALGARRASSSTGLRTGVISDSPGWRVTFPFSVVGACQKGKRKLVKLRAVSGKTFPQTAVVGKEGKRSNVRYRL